MDMEEVDFLNEDFSSLETISNRNTLGRPRFSEYKNLKKQILPQHPESLFYLILFSKNIEKIVFKWRNEFFTSKESAIHDLYQLYVDICTYQYINVKTFLEEQGKDLDELVPYMDNSYNRVITYTHKYFLSIQNKYHKKKIYKIDKFIEFFVDTCFKEKLIFDNDLFNKLIKFFMLLCGSRKRPTRHTGVYLGIKHLTRLIHTSARICRKITYIKSAQESIADPEIIEELQTKSENLINFENEINTMICYMQSHIFKENVNYQDLKLHFMRKELILELYKWIEIDPERHLHNENLNYFVRAMTDRHKIVRHAAIKMVSQVIENFETQVYSKLDHLMHPIFKQLRDIDYNIGIMAVDTLTLIQRHIRLPNAIREVLLNNIYNEYFPLANACGRYLVQLINQSIVEENGDEAQLKALMLFERKAIRRGHVGVHSYLIESIYIYFSPILQNVKTFLNLYKSLEMNEECKEIWLNLLTESVFQTFTGKCREKREEQPVYEVDKEIKKNMEKDLLASLQMLLDNYSGEKVIPLLLLLRDKVWKGKKNKPWTVNESQFSVEGVEHHRTGQKGNITSDENGNQIDVEPVELSADENDSGQNSSPACNVITNTTEAVVEPIKASRNIQRKPSTDENENQIDVQPVELSADENDSGQNSSPACNVITNTTQAVVEPIKASRNISYSPSRTRKKFKPVTYDEIEIVKSPAKQKPPTYRNKNQDLNKAQEYVEAYSPPRTRKKFKPVTYDEIEIVKSPAKQKPRTYRNKNQDLNKAQENVEAYSPPRTRKKIKPVTYDEIEIVKSPAKQKPRTYRNKNQDLNEAQESVEAYSPPRTRKRIKPLTYDKIEIVKSPKKKQKFK